MLQRCTTLLRRLEPALDWLTAKTPGVEFWTSRSTSLVVFSLLVFHAVAVSVAAPLGIYFWDNYEFLFREGKPITIISAIQILLIASLAWHIYRHINGREPFAFDRATSIWGLMAFGFVFLALDELLRIHETLDHTLHKIVGAEETALSDRIDDLILALYGLAGAVACYYYRAELFRMWSCLPLLFAAFISAFVMIGLDALTNGEQIFAAWIADAELAKFAHMVVCIIEEGMKLVAEALFLGAFHRALVQTVGSESCQIPIRGLSAELSQIE